MWQICFGLSVGCVVAAILIAVLLRMRNRRKKVINILLVGVFFSAFLLFVPVRNATTEPGLLGGWQAFLLSLFNALQVFTTRCQFDVVQDNIALCPEALQAVYLAWAATLFVGSPILSVGVVLSLFKNAVARLRYWAAYFRDAYIFSSLNEKSLALASDIKKKHPDAAIVFTDVIEDSKESTYERVEKARQLGAICFKKDIRVVDFKLHAAKKTLWFFTMDEDEAENTDQALKLIETYKNRENTNIYVFSTKIESELLLTDLDKGHAKVRRIHEVRSLVNQVLYENPKLLFDSAWAQEDGKKCISAAVVGMGNHGTEMVKALAWFGQMDGYSLQIDAFDRDALARERFEALAPELMDAEYNGVYFPGEAQYKITVHSGVDVQTQSFSQKIGQLKKASYVLVALGDDSLNIQTAVSLRMQFERMGIHPVIQAIIYNARQKKALAGIKNFQGQDYNIQFIGDIESSFTEQVIIDSKLEEDALRRHRKWGPESTFWTYEYNYRSSTASAIHINARIACGIPGAHKREEDLTKEERDIIEPLEHRRWNAYMRAEGYVYSGSKDKKSRNDLGKMHHNLIKYADLAEEDKRKDSRVGTH